MTQVGMSIQISLLEFSINTQQYAAVLNWTYVCHRKNRQPIKSIEKQKASSRAHIWLDTTKKRNLFLNRFQMSRTEMSSNKHTDLPSAISLKTEMLRKNIQTRSSHCLSPVKIFSSTSSTSVPTHVCCVWQLCWKDVQIKESIRASVTPYPISQGSVVELQSRGSV